MSKRVVVIVVSALLAAGAIGTAVVYSSRPDDVAYVRANVAAVPLIATGAVAAVILLVFGLRSRSAIHLERVRAGAALEATTSARAERLRFLRRLDHELKNPLTAMRAASANIAGGASPTEIEAGVRSIDDQARRVSRLLGDLRKLADIEQSPIDRAPVDVGELLSDVEAALREEPAARERVIELAMPRAPWPVPAVVGDRDLLFLALFNLATNSLKFTAPGDTIELRVAEEDHIVAIEIADTGSGIAPDEVDLVWDELHRGRAAVGVPGSGVGLALVRIIVERHGGNVSLRSRLGDGTVVRVTLPIV